MSTRTRSKTLVVTQVPLTEQKKETVVGILRHIVVCGSDEAELLSAPNAPNAPNGSYRVDVTTRIKDDPANWDGLERDQIKRALVELAHELERNMLVVSSISAASSGAVGVLAALTESEPIKPLVIVNCRRGVSRSVAVVLVWLIGRGLVENNELEDAVTLLGGNMVEKRPDTRPEKRLMALRNKTYPIVCAAGQVVRDIFEQQGIDSR